MGNLVEPWCLNRPQSTLVKHAHDQCELTPQAERQILVTRYKDTCYHRSSAGFPSWVLNGSSGNPIRLWVTSSARPNGHREG